MRDGNFSLDGLLGFDLYGRTVGVVGTGIIGATTAAISAGSAAASWPPIRSPTRAFSSWARATWNCRSCSAESDIITLHCPLLPETTHLIDRRAISRMRRGVMLINTSRGGLVDSAAVVAGLKAGRIGSLGLDVYEEETELFSHDLSSQIIQDDVFSRLLTFPNVIVTAHQGYFTSEALHEIATTTLRNVSEFEAGRPLVNESAPGPGGHVGGRRAGVGPAAAAATPRIATGRRAARGPIYHEGHGPGFGYVARPHADPRSIGPAALASRQGTRAKQWR